MSRTEASSVLELKQGFGNRTVLGTDYVEVTRWGNTQRVPKMALAGMRMTVGRYGLAHYKLIPTDAAAKPISFVVAANKRAQAAAALAGLKDLDKADFEGAMQRIKNDDAFGATQDERMATLANEKRQTLVANWVAGGIGAWGIFYPHPHEWAVAANAAAFAALILVTVLKQGRWRFEANKNDPRPSAQIGLWIGAAALLVRSIFDVDTFDWLPWLSAGAGVGLAAAVLALMAFAEVKKAGSIIAAGILGAMFGIGAVGEANAIFDASPGQVYQTQITDKYESHGRTSSYDLVLGPWGPSNGGSETVSYDVYSQFNVGDTACVSLHTGALHMRWYVMLRCEGLAPSAAPNTAAPLTETPSDKPQPSFDKPSGGKPR